MDEVKRWTLWMVSEFGCELEPYSEESPDGAYVLASDYDQLKAENEAITRQLEIANGQIYNLCQERDTIRTQLAEIESALVAKNHEAHDLEIDNRQLRTQLAEARKLLADAQCYADEDYWEEWQDRADAWLAANPA